MFILKANDLLLNFKTCFSKNFWLLSESSISNHPGDSSLADIQAKFWLMETVEKSFYPTFYPNQFRAL